MLFISISISCVPTQYRDTETYIREKQVELSATDVGGYEEEDRKEIFLELIELEKEAEKEAIEEYPLDKSDPNYAEDNHNKYKKLKKELTEKYTNELAEKYGLTYEKVKEIRMEGFLKDWSQKDY